MAVAALALAAVVFAWLVLKPPGEPRNVVLIVVDTLRRDHLQIYGYPRETAPTLGRLAAQGALFDGLSPTSWTKPAVASILTGLHPIQHQALGFSDGLSEEAVTLAEVLSRAGYSTAGFAANRWVVVSGFEQGFEQLVWVEPEGINFADAGKVNRAVRERLSALREPFFLYVHYMDPHVPYSPQSQWDRSPLPERLARQVPLTSADLQMPVVMERPAQVVRDAIDLYDGEVRQADDGIAELLSLLDGAGRSRSTLVVVTGDHGEEFQEHGRMGHGRSLYGPSLRVPLLFHAPGLVRPGTRLGSATHLDILPTVLDLLGLEMPEGPLRVQGRSLGEALRSGRAEPAGREEILFHMDYREGHALAFQQDGHKLLLARHPYTQELFDLRADPGERHNRWTEAEPVRRNLAAGLVRAHAAAAQRTLPRRLAQVPGEDAKKLQAIGYVGAQSRDPEPREIPRRIFPASPEPGGPVGWENLASYASCFQLDDPAREEQLLRGWHGIEAGGRWTAGSATLVLPASPSPSSLTVTGTSYRPDRFHFRVLAGGRTVAETELGPGAFRLDGRVGAAGELGYQVLSLETDSVFRPADVGGEDPRTLGVFLSSVCLGSGP